MQTTVLKPVYFKGKGLHSGIINTVIVSPAPANTGLVFYSGGQEIVASYKNVIHKPLCTNISNRSSNVKTIEHLLAALYCAGIDNTYIYVDNNEIPIFDGSCKYLFNKISKVGKKSYNVQAKRLKILREVEYSIGNRYVKISPRQDNNMSIDLNIKPKCGHQNYRAVASPEKIIKDCIDSRTFGPMYKGLLGRILSKFTKNPLVQGANFSNTILLTKNKSWVRGGLRYNDEHVRHRVIDLIGDIVLCGTNHINAHIETSSTSHMMNAELLKKIFENKDNYEWVL